MRLVLSAALLVLASPLAAAGLTETHSEITAPAGKLNAKAFRPNAPQPCVAAVGVNPSGNRVLATLPARALNGCSEAASSDVAARR